MQGEQVGCPPRGFLRQRQVLTAFEGVFGSCGKVMCALGLGEARQVRARMREIGQYLVEYLDGQRFEFAL